MNAYWNALVRGLESKEGLALGLRLLLLRRLELETAAARQEWRRNDAESPTDESATQRARRETEAIKAKVRSFPRNEDTIDRIARLAEPERSQTLAGHILNFTGLLGERLRSDADVPKYVARLADAGALDEVLSRLFEIELEPEKLTDRGFDQLSTELRDLAAGTPPHAPTLSAWSLFAGIAAPEAQTSTTTGTTFSIEIELSNRINWAMERNGIPIVHEVRIKNLSDKEIADAKLTLELGPGFSETFETAIPPLPPHGAQSIARPDLKLIGARFLSVLESDRAELLAVVLRPSGETVSKKVEVDVLAFNEWNARALPELLAAFVLPNHPAVQKTLEGARDVLFAQTGDPSLAGYQLKSMERVRATARAVYEALQKLEITYASPAASFEASGQKIRLPDQVIEHKMGTCLDLVCLAAAALEQIGLNPVLLLEAGHAYMGVWCLDDWFPIPAVVDHDTVRKLSAVGDLLLFDITQSALRPIVDFPTAVAVATKRLEDPETFVGAIDIRAARRAKILPLPLGGQPGVVPTIATPLPGPTPAAATSSDATESPLAGAEKGATHRRINEWMKRLLDLSLRNRLLSIDPESEKVVAIDMPEVGELEDAVSSGEWLSLDAKIVLEKDPRHHGHLDARGAEEQLATERQRLLAKRILPTRLSGKELDRRLTIMARQAKSEKDERGTSTLYLAIGLLKWYETAESERERHAPILLCPVDLERKSARSPVRLRLRDDEIRKNDTLFEKLRLDFDLEFDELKTLPQDDSGVDVDLVLLAVRRVCSRIARWDVLPEAVLGFFPFPKILMWDDLRSRTPHLLKNDLFKILVGEKNLSDRSAFDGKFPEPKLLDKVAPASKAKLVVDADASQHCAVEAALAGKSFVLQGPPGTGKSQTITNIIAAMLAAKKRVLFVAEKRAALEVVANRLDRIGLRDACLELHGKDVSKRDVIMELARVLEGSTEPAVDLETGLASRIDADVSKLNAFVARLHQPTALGKSHYGVVAELCRLRGTPRIDFGFKGVLETPRSTHENRIVVLKELEASTAEVAPIVAHPFRSFRPPNWTPLRAQEWRALFAEVVKTANGLRDRAVDVKSALALPDGGTIGGYEAHIRWLEVMGQGDPGGALAIAARADRADCLRRLDDIHDRLEAAQKIWDGLDERWEIEILDLDLDQLRSEYRQKAGSLFKFFTLGGAKKELARAAKGPLGKADDLLADLEAAHELRELVQGLDGEQDFLASFLRSAAKGWRTDPGVTSRVLEAARLAIEAETRVRRIWPEATLLGKEILPKDRAKVLGDELRNAVAAVRASTAKLQQVLGFDVAAEFSGPLEAVSPQLLAERAAIWEKAVDRLKPWSRWLGAADECKNLGLGGIVDRLRKDELSGSLVALYERSFFERFFEESIEASPELAAFDARAHESVIARFRRDDVTLIGAGGKLMARDFSANRPRATGLENANSEVGTVQREAKKKTRHLPLRKLFEKTPTLLPLLKPCLLMSPLSIAQYLPPEGEVFDLVIFDEASQIATHDAVGAIARGKQVIIVGDSKQLPPTSFFATEVDENTEMSAEGEFHVDELESILDECTASQVPDLVLRWHYRSRDESLITFSNHHYYKSALFTFPAGQGGKDFGVSLVPIDGVYDRAKSHTNRAEADAIVAYIVAMLRDPARRGRSIGVVTFNSQQQTLIEDLLDVERRKYPEIEPFFADAAPEPVFVKNLENVQGDERDVMLFSITYGPDAMGRVLLNFGPLSKSGGERRLNVAITRAREQLIVFSTLRPEKIDLARTQSVGTAHLREFLRYAEEGPRALANAIRVEAGALPESPLEKEIAEALRERGHVVDLQVGCSGYRIDVGIRDAANPGRYLLGVECDGAAYHSAATARERDRLRDSVLRNLGWTIHRVWSADWWHDRAQELARIEAALAAAKAAPSRPRAAGANAKVEVVVQPTTSAEESVATETAEKVRATSLTEIAVVAAGAPAEAAKATIDATPEKVEAPAIEPVQAAALAAAGSTSAEAAKTESAPKEAPQSTAPESIGKKKSAKKKSESTEPELPPGLKVEPYKKKSMRRRGDVDALMNPLRTVEWVEIVREVVREEGPVHRDVLWSRFAESFEVARIGPRIEERLANLLSHAATMDVDVVDEFLWPKGHDRAAYDRARVPAPGDDDPRPLEHIAPEELAAAASRILRANLGMLRADLVRSTMALFGWKRLTAKSQAVVDRGIDVILARGICTQSGDHIRWKWG